MAASLKHRNIHVSLDVGYNLAIENLYLPDAIQYGRKLFITALESVLIRLDRKQLNRNLVMNTFEIPPMEGMSIDKIAETMLRALEAQAKEPCEVDDSLQFRCTRPVRRMDVNFAHHLRISISIYPVFLTGPSDEEEEKEKKPKEMEDDEEELVTISLIPHMHVSFKHYNKAMEAIDDCFVSMMSSIGTELEMTDVKRQRVTVPLQEGETVEKMAGILTVFLSDFTERVDAKEFQLKAGKTRVHGHDIVLEVFVT